MTKSTETVIDTVELYELYSNLIDLKIGERYDINQMIITGSRKKNLYPKDMTNSHSGKTYFEHIADRHKQLGEEIDELIAKRDSLISPFPLTRAEAAANSIHNLGITPTAGFSDAISSVIPYEEHLVNEERREAEDREAAAEIDRNCISFEERVKQPDVIRALEALKKAIICGQLEPAVVGTIEIDGIEHKGYWVWDNEPKRKGHWVWGEPPTVTRQILVALAQKYDKQLKAAADAYNKTSGKGKKGKK